MAFPTGKTMSGVKSDTGGSTYKYSTGVQPNGTPSIGNWNTGGSVVGSGDSKGVFAPDGSRIGGQVTDPRLTGGANVWSPQEIAQIGGRPGGLMPMPGGLVPGVAVRPIPPAVNPVVAALTRRVMPGALSMPPGYPGHPNHPSWPRPAATPDPWSAAYAGYRPGRSMGAGQQGTTNWRNSTTVQPTGSVLKDQSRVPSDQYKGFNNPW